MNGLVILVELFTDRNINKKRVSYQPIDLLCSLS